MGNSSSQLPQPQEDYDTWLVSPSQDSIRSRTTRAVLTPDATPESMPRRSKKQDKKAAQDEQDVPESTQEAGVNMDRETHQANIQEGESSQSIDPAVDPRLQEHQAIALSASGIQNGNTQHSTESIPISGQTVLAPDAQQQALLPHDIASRAMEANDESFPRLAEQLRAVQAEVAGDSEFLSTPEGSGQGQAAPKKIRGRPKKSKKSDSYVPASQMAHGQQDVAVQPTNGMMELPPNPYAVTEAPAKPKKRKRGQSDQDDEPRNKRQRANGVIAPTDHNLPTSGPFDKAEEDVIDQFVQQFRNDHNLSQELLNNTIQDRNRARDTIGQEFWKEAYQCLPNRNAKAMQRHLRRKYHNFEARGKWTAEEDETLEQAYTVTPNKWTSIGERMGRMPEDCRDRWRNYVSCGTNRKMAVWTEGEEMNLSEAVGECIRDSHDAAKREAKEKRLAFREDQDWESLVNFNVVSAKMNHTRSRLQCLTHWKKIKARAAKEEAGEVIDGRRKAGSKHNWRSGSAAENYGLMLPGDKYDILHAIMDSDTFSEDRIPWRLISQRSPGSPWTTADRKAAWDGMKAMLVHPPVTLKDMVQELIEYFEQNHADQLNDHFEGPRPKRKKGRKKGGKNRKTLERQPENHEMGGEAGSNVMDFAGMAAAPVAQMVPSKSARKGKAKKVQQSQKSAEKITASDEEMGDASQREPEVDPALENIGAEPHDETGSNADPVMDLQTYNETHDQEGNPIPSTTSDEDGAQNSAAEHEGDDHMLPPNQADMALEEEEAQPSQRRSGSRAPSQTNRRARRIPAGRVTARNPRRRGDGAQQASVNEESDVEIKSEAESSVAHVAVANMGQRPRTAPRDEVAETEASN